jgi:uncharacterized UBP type Zn finger protein
MPFIPQGKLKRALPVPWSGFHGFGAGSKIESCGQKDGEGGNGMKTCTHMNEIRDVTPRTPNGCEECLKMGDTWVHLRLCLECGHVGCCDSSKNKHATKHFHRTKHPIIKSFEPGETWGWCYIDEVELDFSKAARA